MEEQFQPSDAVKQCIAKWVTLKQTHSVTAYMNEVDALHNTWRLCEQAEFGLALYRNEERTQKSNPEITVGKEIEVDIAKGIEATSNECRS